MSAFTAAQVLLELGADVNASTANEGFNPLQYAASRGFADVVRVLISFGANVNQRDVAGETPLVVCTRRGHIEVARLLLAAAADVNLKNNHGHTPLFLAVKMARMELADVLRSHGGLE